MQCNLDFVTIWFEKFSYIQRFAVMRLAIYSDIWFAMKQNEIYI